MRAGRLLSVNLGRATPGFASERAGGPGVTGIDKRPVEGPVMITDPGPKGSGASGVAGDAVCNLRYHGGHDQAVYAYAGEDLDAWQEALGRALGAGSFGENLTTESVDVTGALIGERWRVGPDCVLEVTAPRLPCRTFATWLAERNWVKRFTERGAPGAYLRVVSPGAVRAGAPVVVASMPEHSVTIGRCFAALTLDPGALPSLLEAGESLPEGIRQRALRQVRRSAKA